MSNRQAKNRNHHGRPYLQNQISALAALFWASVQYAAASIAALNETMIPQGKVNPCHAYDGNNMPHRYHAARVAPPLIDAGAAGAVINGKS